MFSENQAHCVDCASRGKSVFCELTEPELQKLDSCKKGITFKKGDVVFQEGAYPNGLYCVQKGKIKVVQLGVDGKEQIVHLATNGDVMGYRAILSGDKYSCSAVAMEESSICFIPKDYFYSMVKESSGIAFQMLQLFSNELKDAERKITSIAQRPVKERLAQSILLLGQRYGYEADGATVGVVITREEIANLTGTTRETAIRFLSEFNHDKIIELNGKKIKILQMKALLQAANLFE